MRCACLPNDAYAQRWRLIRQTLIYLQPLVMTTERSGLWTMVSLNIEMTDLYVKVRFSKKAKANV